MATRNAIHCGYVLDPHGNVFVQLPADNARGFVIADDDRTWDFPPFASWTAVADDDPRVTAADCERLGWLLYESRGPDAHPEGCSCGDPDCPAFLATQSGEARCEECGWEGDWADVWVEVPDPADPDRSVVGPDPDREHPDAPYYCPECGESLE
jgi:hypothetical protein